MWLSIAEVPGVGDSDQENTYTYTDSRSSRQTIYYRLRQFDFDGENYVSDMVSVDAAPTKGETLVSPNPVSSFAQIYTPENGRIRLLQMSGGSVVGEYRCEAGYNELDMSGLMAGTYVVQVLTASGVTAQRIVKQ